VSVAACFDAARSRTGIGIAQEDHLVNRNVDLPQVTIATHDYNRLMSVAAMDRHQRRPHCQFLMSELRRAALCHPDALPEDVVSTNAKVTYRLNGSGRPMAHVLVYPEDLLWPGAELSVLTPLGIALLGLRVGDRMPFRADPDGPLHEVVVEDVQFRLLADEVERAMNAPVPAGNRHDNSRESLDRRLDDALMETFPASDPVSVIVCYRPDRPVADSR
jgi:transcription elongation GreA/GreB family factor